GNAAVLELAGQAEVEVRVVHEQRHVRALAIGLPEDAVEDAPQTPQMPDDLDEADDRQVSDMGQHLRSLVEHVVAAQAEDLEARHEGTEVPQELARVKIARRLAAGDEKADLVAQDAQYSPERVTACPQTRTFPRPTTSANMSAGRALRFRPRNRRRHTSCFCTSERSLARGGGRKMSRRVVVAVLAMGCVAAPVMADHAQPRGGGGSGSASAGARHPSGGGSPSSGGSGGGSYQSGGGAVPRSPAELRHPRPGTGTGYWPGYGHYP